MLSTTPTRSVIVSAIKTSTAFKTLPKGKSIHAHIIKSGYLPETQLFNHLLNLYSRSSDFVSAHKVFDEMPDRNLVSFATLISGYSRSDTPQFSLGLVPDLQDHNLTPNQFVFSSLILACSKLKCFNSGEQIHTQVIVSGFESDPFVQASLVDMYSKFGDLESAVSVFGSNQYNDLVTYNSMISGYVSLSSYVEAFELFVEMHRTIYAMPTESTFGSVIKACSNLGIEYGDQIHCLCLKNGFVSNCFVGTSLVDMYGKLGDMESSSKVFESVPFRDLALHNSIIAGFSNNSLHHNALKSFYNLKSEGIVPNECTFCSLLKSCGSLKSIDLGKIIHGVVVKTDLSKDLFLNTALIDMYMKWGCTELSSTLFSTLTERNTVVYNAMIHGHVQYKNFDKALCLFIDMNWYGIEPNHATFVALMSSCIAVGKNVFAFVIKHGFGFNPTIQNVLLDSLVKGGEFNDAQLLLEKMKETDVVSWTTIISGLSQFGLHSDSLKLFKKMQLANVYPNSFTFSSILKACGSIPDLDLGKCIHGCTIKHGIMGEHFTVASLIDIYAKCGNLQESGRVFNTLLRQDIVVWNTMISAYAQYGDGLEALNLLERMERNGIKPNEVTFTSLLSACSRCGLVDEGFSIFASITSKYGMTPSMEHFSSMVDLLGRAGLLERAKNLIDSMPYEPDASIRIAFLASCKMHGSVKLIEDAQNKLLDIGLLENPGIVLMSNLYSESGKWENAVKVRERMKEKGLKEAGMSWLQIRAER